MKILNTKIDGVFLIKPQIIKDKRGYFFESFNQKKMNEKIKVNFVQDNQSLSSKNILRGLHFQRDPLPQGKLVRCISGEIFDVAVDIRKNSESFGKWVGVYLNSTNHNQLWIPEGFAHGFLTISEKAEVVYKTTNFWDKNSERSIKWDDPLINIEWPEIIVNNNGILVSPKDSQAPLLSEVNSKDLF